MQITRPAAAGADGERTGQMRLGSGRERSHFLVPDGNPFYSSLTLKRVSQAIEAVSDDSVNALDTRGDEYLLELIGNCLHD
jgi:hypothetical protein